MSESLIGGSFAIGGVIVGGCIAFFSAYVLDLKRRRSEGRAAVRLLRSELTTNDLIAEEIIEGNAIRPFEDSHWQLTRFQLAQTLTFDQFVDVGKTYVVLPYYQAIAEQAIQGQPLSSEYKDALTKWRGELAQLSLSLFPYG